jgi:hypothetical protein
MSDPSPSQPGEESLGKAQRAERRAIAVAAAVLRSLGQPPGFRQVIAVRLWGDHFRVNVLTGDDAASVRVAHSFFLAANEDGQVTESEPAITRLY